MTYISWLTLDTGKSICNNKSGNKLFTVYMHDNNGNLWEESNYDGFGNFGGKNYFDLFAEMNNLDTDGFEEYHFGNGDYEYPILTEFKKTPKSFKIKNVDDPEQGFFYGPMDCDENEIGEENEEKCIVITIKLYK